MRNDEQQTRRGSASGAAAIPAGQQIVSFAGLPGLQSPPGAPITPDLGFAARPFDPQTVRRDFPILQERVHGRPLIWLDNAATTQKPNSVIERLSEFYRQQKFQHSPGGS